MNLPTGIARGNTRNTHSVDAKRELDDLAASGFSGYVIESILLPSGLEESALVFRNGVAVGSQYEYYSRSRTLQGDESLPHALNAFLAEHAVVDVVELSVQQVDLVTAFNPKLKFSKPIPKGGFKPFMKDTFDASLAEKVSSSAPTNEPATKESLFKKFGLAGIEGA